MGIQPNLRTDARGFVRYGRAKLPVRVVGGVLEFVIKEPDFAKIYGRRVLVEVEQLAALCDLRVTELDTEVPPMIK